MPIKNLSIKVLHSNGVMQDVTEYLDKASQASKPTKSDVCNLSPPYEMDGEDGFVPDMIDEGRDSSSKSSRNPETFDEDHLIKVYILSPFLFGKVFQPDIWMKYLYEAGLLATSDPTCIDALSRKHLYIVEIFEKIHEVVVTGSKKYSQKKQMRDLFDTIDKSVFDLDAGHLKARPLTEIIDRSRKFSFLDAWHKAVKEKQRRDYSAVLDDRAISVALLFTCRQFVEHWHKLKKGENLLEKFKARAKKKDKQIQKVKEDGNKYFKQGSYQKASDFYSKAIQESPFNAILYGNRAQSCLNYGSYDNALTDGKRTIVLDPWWHKGYHRYAEAFYRLNQKEKAFSVLEIGLSFCPHDRNLLDQRERFKDPEKYNKNRISAQNKEEPKHKSLDNAESESLKASESEESDSDDGLPDLVSGSGEDDEDSDCLPGLATASDESEKEDDVAIKEEPIKLEKKVPIKSKHKSLKKSKKNSKTQPQPWQSQRNRTDSETEREIVEKNSVLAKSQEKDDRHTEIYRALKQGSESLLDNRCLNAIFFYNKCLDIIKKHKIENITRFVEVDVILLKYSLGISCVEMGSCKEIHDGMKYFNEILVDHSSVKFPLTFYGLGKAWLKQFRFVQCLETAEKGLEVVRNMSQQVRHTWPGTTVAIKESEPGALKEALEEMVVQCRNPPTPDAVCRYPKCHGYYSINIYMSDPEFKGFVQIRCFAKCVIEYHVECWRRFKKDRLCQSDKDYLNSLCLTPACQGRISKIHVYDQLGATVKELITPAVENNEPPHPKAAREKMKLSSAAKIEKRNAKKLSRKQRKKEVNASAAQQVQSEKTIAEAMTQQILKDGEVERETEPEVGHMERLAEAHVYQTLVEANGAEIGTQFSMEKYMTVLHKREEEEPDRKAVESKAIKGRSKKKQKSKKTMTLEEFVGPKDPSEEVHSPVYMDTMDDFAADSGLLDLEKPFARPSNGTMKQELDLFDGIFTETSSVASSGSHSDNKHSEIKETLFSFFGGILGEYGPLDKDDVIIKRELEDFPAEAHEVIDNAGGIDKLLLQSLNFSVVDNFVCLLRDTVKAKRLAELHKNPLMRSESPLYTNVSKPSSKTDFPSLGDSLPSRGFGDNYAGFSKLDELDIFTTTAGNLDSPTTSPTGINSVGYGSWSSTSTVDPSAEFNGTAATSVGNSPAMTLSKSSVGTIVHSVESTSSKGNKTSSTTKDDSVNIQNKSKKAGNIKEQLDSTSKVTISNKIDSSNTSASAKQKSQPDAQTAKKTETKKVSSVSQNKQVPEKPAMPPLSEIEVKNVQEVTKVTNKKFAASFPVNFNAATESSKENSSKIDTPEISIQESFKKQVHAAATLKKTSANGKKNGVNKEKVTQIETIQTSAEKEKKVATKEMQKNIQPTKEITKKKTAIKIDSIKKNKLPQENLSEASKINCVAQANPGQIQGLVKPDFNDVKKASGLMAKLNQMPNKHLEIETIPGDERFNTGIMRSCDDVSPVNSEPFSYPMPSESETNSQSSMQPVFDPTWSTPSANNHNEIWNGINVSLSDTKLTESGPWKSKLQEWKMPMEEGYAQLDTNNDDDKFMTLSRTTDKDQNPNKDIGVIGSSSNSQDTQPPKISKPPGFGGKAYKNSPLDRSANGASKYGPIGSRSKTDSPVSESSRDSSKTSTPVHGIPAEIGENQLPPFPTVHTGEALLSGPSLVPTNLPMDASFSSRSIFNSSVWSSTPAPLSFNPNIPISGPSQIGFTTNTDSTERSVQNSLKQSDECFITEMTDSVYQSLCDNEAFKSNPLLKENIEADIRCDIERSKSTAIAEKTVDRPAKSKVVKPKVKTRNSACQYVVPQEYFSSVECNTDPYEPYKEDLIKARTELDITNLRLQELMDKHTQLQNSSNAELKNLRSLVDALELECKGLRKERTKAVEERDTESRKWNNEKRLVAEEVKNMKKDMKNAKFREENAVRQFQEAEGEIRNLNAQLNLERETIISEREKFQCDKEELHSSHSIQLSRAEAAEVNLLKLKVEVGTQILDRSLKDAVMYATQSHQMLQSMKDNNQPAPQPLLLVREQWKGTVKKIKDIKLEAMTQFEEQIRQIRQGTALSALPELPIPRPPPAPENPMAVMNTIMRPGPGGMPGRGSNKVPSGAIPTNRPPNVRLPTSMANQKGATQVAGQFNGPPPLHNNVRQPPLNTQASQHKSKSAFDKILDKLSTLFPNHSRSDMTKLIQDLRSSRNGSLSGMSLNEIVMRVAEMILKENARKSNMQATQTSTALPPTLPSYPPVAARMSPNPERGAVTDEIFEEEENPCIICHDEMNAAPSVHLECCHRFHTECIKKWFREQSTCPTCRVHALLPDDFPTLGQRPHVLHKNL